MYLGTLPETQSSADDFARQQGMNADDLTLVEKFKSKVDNFTEALDSVRSRNIDNAKYPDIAAQRNALLTRGGILQRTITSITGLVDKVMAFFSGTGLNGLGIIPLLPLAAISIAVAAITKWTTDAYELSKRMDAIQALEAKGYDPVRAGQIVNQQIPRNNFSFGGIGSLMPWVAVAGVVFFVIKTGKLK